MLPMTFPSPVTFPVMTTFPSPSFFTLFVIAIPQLLLPRCRQITIWAKLKVKPTAVVTTPYRSATGTGVLLLLLFIGTVTLAGQQFLQFPPFVIGQIETGESAPLLGVQ